MEPPEDRIIGDIQGATDKLAGLDKVMRAVTGTAASFAKTFSSGFKGTPGYSSGTGQLNLGSSGTSMMPTSLASMSSIVSMGHSKSLFGSMLGGLVQGAAGLIGGGMMMMPDVMATAGMASGEYRAAIAANGWNRNQVSWNTVGNRTINMMGAGGMNIPGAPGILAAQLSSQGVQFGGGSLAGGAGQYSSITRSVGGAARMMNIQNDVAAQSFSSMYSGSTSMGMLQNFGIYTTDPRSGKSATPTQILAMLNNRLTGGGAMSAKQVATALGPGGMLNADIQASGLDAAGQDMLRQYMLSASNGKYLNFDKNAAANSSLTGGAGGNPLQPQLDVLTAQTKTMQAAATSYIGGMKAAASAIVKFQDAITHFLGTPAGKFLAGLNGGAALAGNTPSIAGGLAGLLGVGGGLLTMGKGLSVFGKNRGAAKGAQQLFLGSGGGKVTPSMGSKLAGSLKAGIRTSGAMSLLTAAPDILTGLATGNASQTSKGLGTAAGSAIGGTLGAAAGALIPGLGETGISEYLLGAAGSYLGGMWGGQIGSSMAGGSKSSISLGGSSDTTGALKLSAPVNAPISTKYGQTTDIHGTALWGGKAHLAIDYAVPVGTPVQAAADGTVIETGSGSGSMSYGNYMIIDHGKGYSTLYAHLSQVGGTKGDVVKRGQVIAQSGKTGYVTGPHLHFETRKNGQPVNPSSLGMGSSVSVVASNGNLHAPGSVSDAVAVGGSSGSAGTLGYNPGVSSTGTGISIPSSYMGASIGGGVNALAAGYRAAGPAVGSSMQNGNGRGSGGGAQGGPGLSVGSKNEVTINLTIGQASDAEAKRFVQIVKQQLEDDHLMSNMGRL